jgi:regulator of ribonuclease activity A
MTTQPGASQTGAEPTADVCDRFGAEAQACVTQLRLYGARRGFAGPIETVLCLDDNVLVRRTLSQPGAGRVLVVDGGGSLACALLGDEMAALAVSSGWAGVVINGAVRDVAALTGIATGVAAVGSNPHRSGKAGMGEVGEPVSFGGATFRPGDFVFVDPDGAVVVPREVMEREPFPPQT